MIISFQAVAREIGSYCERVRTACADGQANDVQERRTEGDRVRRGLGAKESSVPQQRGD